MKKSERWKDGGYPTQLEELASLIAQMEPEEPEMLLEIAGKVDDFLQQDLPKPSLQSFSHIKDTLARIEAGDLDPKAGYHKLVQCIEALQYRMEKETLSSGLPPVLSSDEMEYMEMLIGVFCEVAREMEEGDPNLIAYCKRSVRKLEHLRHVTPELLERLKGIELILDYLEDKKVEFEEGHRLILDALAQVEEIIVSMRENHLQASPPAVEERQSNELLEEAFIDEQVTLLEKMEEDILVLDEGGDEAVERIATYIDAITDGCDSLGVIPLAETLREICRELRSSSGGKIAKETVGSLLFLKDTVMDFLIRLDGEEEAVLDERAIKRIAGNFRSGMEEIDRGERAEARMISTSVDIEELSDFLTEAPEFVQGAESALMQLENNPGNPELLNEAFRSFHNLKGTASFLELEDVVRLAHAAEGILSEARDGLRAISQSQVTLLLGAVDLMREFLERIRSAGPGQSYVIPSSYYYSLWGMERGVRNQSMEGGTHGVEEAAESVWSRQTCALEQAGESIGRGGYIKVATEKLDDLIDNVGELVIVHSMVQQEIEAETGEPQASSNIALLSKITRELQELALGMRMVSLKSTFRKMARLARDLSVQSDLEVDFTYSGEDTEIDRNMVDEINQPLIHLIRNAVDHGLEIPTERRRAGKSETGHIWLRGYHDSGSVVIEMEDDGRGLDKEAILDRAASMGLLRDDVKLSDEDVYDLIFHEGLTTACDVTDISGMGVGLDVVQSTVERLMGRVEVSSVPGQGTKLTIRLPLTLAIIDGMEVKVCEEHYVVPSIAIQESLSVKDEQLSTVTGEGEAVLLRDEIIPLYRLHNLFRIDGAKLDPREALVLVLGMNGKKFALMVDDIVGQQQVVIKSLGETFSGVRGVSGGAIMGTGRVSLILDPLGIMQLAQEGDGREMGEKGRKQRT
ncbi:MAG: chemotaxis protein CheA [Actinomycetota bacterium]|nr:chemotaxis protein CheA [Actinomycetota bacterium]